MGQDILKQLYFGEIVPWENRNDRTPEMAELAERIDGETERLEGLLDAEGKAHKPFVLPQSDPEKDDLTLKSYNIPDLSATPVPFDASSIKRINRQLKAEKFK